jgi:calcineurin-like phosphoesterase family protein
MPIGNTLVSYNDILRPFPDRQTLLGSTRQAAGKVIADSSQADAKVAQFSAALDSLQAAQGNIPNVMHTPRNALAAQLQSHLASRAVQDNKLETLILKGVDFVLEAFTVKFSSADWFEYMLSFFTWIEDLEPAQCPPAPNAAAPVANNFRMALLGDWGTGLYGAPVSAAGIAADTAGYDLLLHLGDVYYSGLPEEIQERFVKFWPAVPGAISRSMNGNHEMYSGGHGYFETLLPKLNQPSSYFAFQNDFWTLVALDTAYSQPFGGQEGDLFQAQADWLANIVAGAENRKIVLFSHHQPFSLLDGNQGPMLIKWLQTYLQAKKIFAWYWGHEHRCLLYDPHPAFGFHGRCVGHGGFPEARTDVSNAPFSPELGSNWRKITGTPDIPSAYLLDSANLYVPTFEAQFAPHGYMRLEFQNDRLTEYVRAPDAANIYLEDLT